MYIYTYQKIFVYIYTGIIFRWQKMSEQLRELKQLHNKKKAHFRKFGAKTNADDMEKVSRLDEDDHWEDEDEFAAGTVQSLKCLGVKCATIWVT